MHSLGAHSSWIFLVLHSIPAWSGYIVAFASMTIGAKVLGPALHLWLGV